MKKKNTIKTFFQKKAILRNKNKKVPLKKRRHIIMFTYFFVISSKLQSHSFRELSASGRGPAV